MKTKEVITRVVSPSSVCEAWRRRSCAAAHRRHPGFHIRRRRRRQPGAQGQGRPGGQEDPPGSARGEKRRTRRDFVSRFFAAKALIEILHGEERAFRNAEIRQLACLHDIKKLFLSKAMLEKKSVLQTRRRRRRLRPVSPPLRRGLPGRPRPRHVHIRRHFEDEVQRDGGRRQVGKKRSKSIKINKNPIIYLSFSWFG